MATLIPSLSQCLPRMTGGEKRLARLLEAKLEDDYQPWYDVPLAGSTMKPDFVILNPRRGFLVLEVKDWKAETLVSIDRVNAVIRTDSGEKTVKNPLEQARGYAQDLKEILERDPLLVQREGPHKGRLVFPWAYGVVLASISRKQFIDGELAEVLPEHLVICRDELSDAQAAEEFQQTLWGMFPWTLRTPLSLPQIDRVRWHVFPEIRIGSAQIDLFPPAPDSVSFIPDLVRVMDLQQEQLARSLGGGHRVIHGVAGSGKTMILGYRAEYLAKATAKPILVLCFNRALTDFLTQTLQAKGLSQRVNVKTFHSWCREQLRAYQVGLPPDSLAPDDFAEQLVTRLIRGVDVGLIPREQYGAVLIDEGHDFKAEWLKVIAQMVSPETNSLLVLYDDAQAIYRHRKFSFKSVGIQAQGRTTILQLNYRNTAEILEFAAAFAKDVLTPEDADEDGVPLLAPRTAGRHGRKPELITLPTFFAELKYMTKSIRQLNESGHSWRDMAVLYRDAKTGSSIQGALTHAAIPFQVVGRHKGQSPLDLKHDSVKVVTFHSSKGLEFPVVAIPGLKRPSGENVKEEARLMYVAMTRAIDQLIVTSSERP